MVVSDCFLTDTAEVDRAVGAVVGAVVILRKLVVYSLTEIFATPHQMLVSKEKKEIITLLTFQLFN